MPRGLRTLQRAAVVSFASGVAVFALAGPALAVNATIPIKAAQVPTTAVGFPTHECTDNQLPQKPGEDGWHFVLPSGSPEPAVFVEVRLTFEDEGGAEHQVTATIGNPTAKHAIVYTPAGWTLIGGAADISGQLEGKPSEFNLSHTCPASASPSPSASPTGSPTGSPTASPTGSPTVTPTGSPTVSGGPSDTPPGSVTPSTSPAPPGQLPVTGLAIGGIVLTGFGLVGAGAAMRALRRRDPAAAESSESDDDGDADDKSTDV
jgi:hypothetical protein